MFGQSTNPILMFAAPGQGDCHRTGDGAVTGRAPTHIRGQVVQILVGHVTLKRDPKRTARLRLLSPNRANDDYFEQQWVHSGPAIPAEPERVLEIPQIGRAGGRNRAEIAPWSGPSGLSGNC